MLITFQLTLLLFNFTPLIIFSLSLTFPYQSSTQAYSSHSPLSDFSFLAVLCLLPLATRSQWRRCCSLQTARERKGEKVVTGREKKFGCRFFPSLFPSLSVHSPSTVAAAKQHEQHMCVCSLTEHLAFYLYYHHQKKKDIIIISSSSSYLTSTSSSAAVLLLHSDNSYLLFYFLFHQMML